MRVHSGSKCAPSAYIFIMQLILSGDELVVCFLLSGKEIGHLGVNASSNKLDAFQLNCESKAKILKGAIGSCIKQS